MTLVTQANITSVRDEVYWSLVESTKGVYRIPEHIARSLQLSMDRGIEPLIILDYGNSFYDGGGMPVSDQAQAAFVRYAEFVAGHYKGRIHRYEVWNEWNIGAGSLKSALSPKGAVADYLRLLAKTSAALKRIDPGLLVLGGAVAGWDQPWIEELFKSGAALHLDGLSLHPYSYNSRWMGRPEVLIDWLAKLEESVRRCSGGKDIPLYLTEIGWPNHADELGTPPEQTADFFLRLILLAKGQPFIGGIWFYDLQDDGADQRDAEHNFGLVALDGSPKPAWFMLRDALKNIAEARFVSRIPAAPGLFALRFSHRDGTSTVALWTDQKEKRAKITVSFAGSPPQGLTLQQPGRGQPFLLGAAAPREPSVSVTAEGAPWLLRGTFQTVRIDVQWLDVAGGKSSGER